MSDADVQTSREQTPAEETSTSTSIQAGVSTRRSPLRGQSLAVQQRMLEPGSRNLDAQRAALSPPVQRKSEGDSTAHVHEAAQRGVAGSGGAMPHLDTIQAAFGGHDVSGVQAHVGGAAAEATAAMGASAYATGNDIAFGSQPDLHTAAHEAAHVIQQRSGVSLSGGVGKAGDSYEQHADQVADAVVAGRSAEALLGGGGGGGEGVQQVQRQASGEMVVQLEGGDPLFDSTLVEMDQRESDGAGEKDAGVSTSVESTAHASATDEQRVEALHKDLAEWEAKRIEVESSLSTTRSALVEAEAVFAQSEFDEAALAEVEALRATVGELETGAELAQRVEAIRRQQVADVAAGTPVGELTRDADDPGIGVAGDVVFSTKTEASADLSGAAVTHTTVDNGTTNATKVEVAIGDELAVGASDSTSNGTDNNTTSARAKATDDGVILTGSNSSREGDTTRTDEISATLEADQVGLAGKHAEGIDTTDKDGNGAKVSFSVSPGVGAKVEVKPNAAGTAYELTGEVYYTIGVGADGSGQSTASAGGDHGTDVKGTAGGSASLSHKASLAFVRPLTSEEAAARVGDLSSQAEGDPLPDFPWLASWREAITQALSGELSASAMSDSAAAAGMRDGESYTAAQSTSWSVCVKGSLGVVSGSAGAGGSGSREMKVAKSAKGVSLALTFGTEATRSADGSVTFEGITVGIGGSSKETYGASVTFLVDPAAADFQSRFGQVEAQLTMATSVDDLMAAKELFAGNVSAFTESTGSADTTKMTIGAAGNELAIGEGTERTDERTQDGVKSTGGSSMTADVKVADTALLHGGINEQGTFEATEEGISADLERKVDSTGLGLEASEWTPAKLWSSLTGGGVKGALAERLTIARSRISHVTVSPENMKVLLTERVWDTANWNRVNVTVRNYEQWGTLGGRLRSPAPKSADVTQYGAELATLIDHCDALADFMTASNAMETLEWALNRWGEDNGGFSGTGGQRSSDTRDLGTYVEWPPAFVAEDPKYTKALEDAAASRDTLSGLGEVDLVNDKTRDLITELVRIKMILEDNASHWEDPRARLEMMGALDTGVIQVRTAKEEVLAAFDMGEDPTMVSVETDTTAVDARQVTMAEELLRDFKSTEQEQFGRMKESLASFQAEQHAGEWFAGLRSVGDQLVAEDWRPVVSEYERMVERWIGEVKSLRSLYMQTTDTTDDWKVSIGVGMPRNLQHEPDIDEYERILQLHSDEDTFWDLGSDSAKKRWLRNNRDY